MKRILHLIVIFSLSILLVACGSAISEKAMAKDEKKFIEAAKICYKDIKANKNPMKNKTCVNLAHLYQKVCIESHIRRGRIFGMDYGFKGCNNLNRELILAIARARQLVEQKQVRKQEDKKIGWN